jgi:AraC-like DNA-binding protein
MNVILLSGSIQAIYFALVLAMKKDKLFSHRLLMLFFFMIAALLSFDYVNSIRYSLSLFHFGSILVLFMGVISWWHVQSIIRFGKLPFSELIHILPLLITGILCFFEVVSAPTIRVLSYMGLLSYLIAIYLYEKKYEAIISQSLSSENSYTKHWLKILSVSMIIVSVSGVISYSPVVAKMLNLSIYQDIIVGIILTLCVFFLGYISTNKLTIPRNRTQAGKIKKEQNALLEDKLLNYMESKRPHLNPELSLNDLAKEMHVNSLDLTPIIHAISGKNFRQFINAYRVEEVKSEILKGAASEYTLLAIAFDCGFNSKASFNRVFKENTGLTPGEFVKSVSKKGSTGNFHA